MYKKDNTIQVDKLKCKYHCNAVVLLYYNGMHPNWKDPGGRMEVSLSRKESEKIKLLLVKAIKNCKKKCIGMKGKILCHG